MDGERFERICVAFFCADRTREGIGTQCEKSLHALLKLYIEPDVTRHEIPACGYRADILNDRGIFEIQTRDLYRLAPKLDAYLAQTPVTVVYPLIRDKWILWVDPETGEVSKRRKSAKHASPPLLLSELYGIRQHITSQLLSVRMITLDTEEYRLLDGRRDNRKKGATKYDFRPLGLVGDQTFSSPADYCAFIPSGLSPDFTTRDYSELTSLRLPDARKAVYMLAMLGLIRRAGTSGRMKLYNIVQ